MADESAPQFLGIHIHILGKEDHDGRPNIVGSDLHVPVLVISSIECIKESIIYSLVQVTTFFVAVNLLYLLASP
jgi:hypothetical protein